MKTFYFRQTGNPTGKTFKGFLIMKGKSLWTVSPLIRLIGKSDTELPEEYFLKPDYVTEGGNRPYYGHLYPIPAGFYRVGQFAFYYDGWVHPLKLAHKEWLFGTTSRALDNQRKSRRKLAVPRP